MLNAEHLRKKAEDARNRAEKERQLQAERQQREDEERIREAGLQKQKKEEKARLQRKLHKKIKEILFLAIQASVKGMKLVDLRFESEDDFENEIYKFFRSHGYKVKIVNRERGIAKTEKLVAKLLNLLDFSPKACEYRQTFNSELSEYGHDSDRLWKLVEEAMADHELVLSTQAQTYIRLTLKPHLQNFYLENSGEKWIEISWQPRDVTQGLVHDLHDIPFWLEPAPVERTS